MSWARGLVPLVVVLVWAFPGSASADRGEVQLADGRNLRGQVLYVLPHDRVMIALDDGREVVVPWSDVRFVLDGSQVYDAAGNRGHLPPPPIDRPPLAATTPVETGRALPVPGAATPAAPGRRASRRLLPESRWGRFRPPNDASPEERYLAMPRRGLTVGYWILTSLLTTTSIGVVVGDLTSPCGAPTVEDPMRWSCADRRADVALGVGLVAVSSGFGALLVRRTRILRASRFELERRGYRLTRSRPALDVALDVGPRGVGSGLVLRF